MTRSTVFRALATACVVVLQAGSLMAAKFIPVAVPERIRGSERVVVATVSQVETSLEKTAEGDEIVMSHFVLLVDESLKGSKERRIALDMEGGTFGDITLDVSSLPKLQIGDRAVFFLERRRGVYHPYLQGQGVVKLQSDGSVKNTSLTLDAIRQMAAASR